MTGNKQTTDLAWTDSEDVPDLASKDWGEVIDATPVRRGRPKAASAPVGAQNDECI